MTIKECFEKIDVLNPLFDVLINLETYAELSGFDANIDLDFLYDYTIKRIQSFFGYELDNLLYYSLKDHIKIIVYIELIKNYLKR